VKNFINEHFTEHFWVIKSMAWAENVAHTWEIRIAYEATWSGMFIFYSHFHKDTML
jgi:hypothetical protein